MKRLLVIALTGALPFAASASLYSQDFDSDDSANWAVNKSTGANLNDVGSYADFYFDYGTMGVPSAPNSGGSTRGLKMVANITGGVFSGLSVSPLGQSFTGDYALRADVWMNFLGPAPQGGSGSTQAGGLGIGTNGTVAQWAASAQSSVHFSTTLDGNSSVDWRAYSSAAATGYPDQSPVFAAVGAGNRNNSHPYYAGMLGVTPPAAQTALFASQTGTTNVGNVAFKWVDMVVAKVGNSITWSVDGLLIATVDATTVNLGGDNILFNYFDTNAGVASDPNGLNFMLVDNVRVDVVPEPATLAVLGIGVASLLRRRKK